MITMKNFRVFVPEKSDALLGYTGENLSRRLTIVVDDPGPWSYKLDIRNDAGAANIMDLTAEDGALYVDIERAALQVSGKVQAQVRAIDGDVVKCSNVFTLFIGDSVQAVEYFESLPPSEFEQLESRMTALKAATETFAEQTAGYAAQVKSQAEQISTDVDRAAGLVASAEEAAARAESAAADVEQAVSDAAGAVRDQVSADADRAALAAQNAETNAASAQAAAQTAAQDAANQTAATLAGYVSDAESAKSGAEAAQAAAERAAQEAEQAAGGGVTSFNSRTGSVSPQSGDYTAGMVGAIPVGEKGAANGVASLDASGKVPAGQLPEMNYDAAGAAAAVQQNLDNHAANGTAHITEEERAAWNAKLDKTGDGSNVTAAFTAATARANITTGEKLSVIFGKLAKWFADLKTVAFTGSYSDLSDTPSIPSKVSDLSNDSGYLTAVTQTNVQVSAATDYTAVRVRGMCLAQDSAPDDLPNGCIAGVYTVS